MNTRLILTLLLCLGLAAPAPAVDMDAAQLHAATKRVVTLQDLGLGFLQTDSELLQPELLGVSAESHLALRLALIDVRAYRSEYPVVLQPVTYYQVGMPELDTLLQAAARTRAALQLTRDLDDKLVSHLVDWAERTSLSLQIKPTEREALRGAGYARFSAVGNIVQRARTAAPGAMVEPAVLTRMIFAVVASAKAVMVAHTELAAANAALAMAERQLRLLPERVSGNPVAHVDLLVVMRSTEEIIRDVRNGQPLVQALVDDSQGLFALVTALAGLEDEAGVDGLATASPSTSPTPAAGR